jgi:hypothetical protein
LKERSVCEKELPINIQNRKSYSINFNSAGRNLTKENKKMNNKRIELRKRKKEESGV